MDGKQWFYLLSCLTITILLYIGFMVGNIICELDTVYKDACYASLDYHYKERI